MMDFQQAEKKFKQLKSQFEAGQLTETEFKAQLEELMVQDEGGNWWMIGYETERWYRHDGTNWVQIDPPNGLSQKVKPVALAPELGNDENMENIAHGPAEEELPEKPADIAKQNIEKLVTNKRFLLSPLGRILLGGILGLFLWLAYASFSYSSGGEVIWFVVVCGLAGLITYPHKSSIAFLILGFLVAGFISDPNLYNPENFVAAGGIFGIPAGALLSRILHWLTVLK
jgi:hypothetical protein